ncbi:MAG: hypothetical protein Q8O89_09075 [Nanoarchaeota archaeon]|nr:hypothetical protein [Nanoarchaeota archaeon]
MVEIQSVNLFLGLAERYAPKTARAAPTAPSMREVASQNPIGASPAEMLDEKVSVSSNYSSFKTYDNKGNVNSNSTTPGMGIDLVVGDNSQNYDWAA